MTKARRGFRRSGCPIFFPGMFEKSTTPSTTTNKVGSHIQIIPPVLPLPIIPPLIIGPGRYSAAEEQQQQGHGNQCDDKGCLACGVHDISLL